MISALNRIFERGLRTSKRKTNRWTRFASAALGALAMFGTTTISAPVLAGHSIALVSLLVPISVNVTPPAATSPQVSGNFVYTVSCTAGAVGGTFSFASPALTLVANTLGTPFASALTGTATSSNTAHDSLAPGCTVTQSSRPTAPTGFFWSGSPAAVAFVVPAAAPSATTITAAPVSFSNTLVAGIPITINIVPPGGGTVVCNPNPVAPGGSSNCTVTASPGYTININTGVSGCGGSADGNYFTNNINAPCTITANFTPDPVPITTIVLPVLTLPAVSGTLTCTPNPGLFGQTSSCAAVPSTGYSLVSIAGCGGSSATTPMTTGLLSSACDVTATFALTTYVVTGAASPINAATVNCASPVAHGATTTCSITAPAAGYTFVRWTSSCGANATTASYTTGAVTAPCAVTAEYSLNQYTVTGAANPVNAGSVSCATPVNHGATSLCSVTATTAGYGFTGWTTSGCGAASSAASYTTGAVTAACTVTAAFALNRYPVSGAASPSNAATVNCVSPVNHGATTTCSASALAAGYTFVRWTSTCGSNSTTASYTTAAVTAPCAVTAEYSLNQYVVTGTANPANAGSVSCATPVNHGATSLCSVSATTAGYVFTGWTTSGCGASSSAATFTTNALTAACTVTAAFAFNTYAISTVVDPVGGGTLNCTPNPVPHGAISVCTANPNPGYAVAPVVPAPPAAAPPAGMESRARMVVIASGGISGCGGVPTATNPFNTAAVTAPCTVTAQFVLNSFAVTGVAVAASGGSVTCGSPVASGNTTSCVVTTNPGHTLSGISGCGGVSSTTSPFVTGPITAACTVTAVFSVYPIPTLGTRALLLLALMMASAGWLMFRRRVE